MENEIQNKISIESINDKNKNKNISTQIKPEEIKNNNDENEINSKKNMIINDKTIKQNTKIDLKNNNDNNYKKINNDENTKKINNTKINNILNDIYGSLTNINEVNEKVKNILSKRKTINSMNSFRNNITKKDSDSKTKNKRSSTTNRKDFKLENIIKEEKIYNKNNSIYKNIEEEVTKNETASINLKSKESNSNFYNNITLKDFSNKSKIKDNYIINKDLEYTKINLPSKRSNNSNLKNNHIKDTKYYKYNELVNTENSTRLNEKNIEYSNINYNSCYYDEEFEQDNENMLKAMRIKLKNEEKKLKDLEDEKNKLLNEERVRRKVLIEKIKKKNKIKKQYLINEYKKKINLIYKLQSSNINEIKKLERKKKIDEDKIIKIDKICENININATSLLKSKINNKNIIRNSLTKRKTDDESETSNYLISDYETGHKTKSIKRRKSGNYYTYLNNNLIKGNKAKNKSNYTENEDGLTEDYQFNQSINELTSTCDNNDENETFSRSQYINNHNCKRKLNFEESFKTNQDNLNPYNYLYNYYKKINKNNNIYYDDEKLNLDNYLVQNHQKKRYYSENRKYDKRFNNTNSKKKFSDTLSPNQEVLSFIQTKVNKYNHSLSKDSTISKRLSQMAVIPTSLNYNFNNNYNYKYFPSSLSNNNMSQKSNKRMNKRKNKNLKELNFKYIFYNNK